MTRARAALDTDSLLGIVLVLVVVWLGLKVVGFALGAFAALLEIAETVVGVVVVVLIVVWLLDRI
jgi:hypothetical protein